MARFGPSAVVVAAVMMFAVSPCDARSPASIDARLDVRIDPSTPSARVEGRVRWINHAAAPVSAVCLVFDGPLASAVSDPESTLLQVRDGDGRMMATSWPQTGVARVVFDEPVEPAAAAVLGVAWSASMAPVGRGRDGSSWAVGGSGPRLVVPRSPGGGCDPRAAAERGRYRLVVDVPGGWRVAATGSEVSRQQPAAPDGDRDRSVWSADGIERTAWLVADERESVVVESDFDPLDVPSEWVSAAAVTLDRPPVELQLPPVHLRIITRPDLARRAGRLLDEMQTAMAWFGLMYGGYPWPQVDMVLVEEGDGEVTAVAPTLALVTNPGPSWPLDPAGGRELSRRAATVVAAETFRSVITFDGSTPGWLAAGLERYAVTSYEAWRRDRAGRRDAVFADAWGRCRLTMAAHVIGGASSDGSDGELLTALVLRSLEHHVGRDAVARGLRAVVESGRLGVASYAALRDALSEPPGEEVGPLLDHVVIAGRPPDWTVRRVASSAAPGSGGGYLTTVELERTHTADVPVEVRLGMADGTDERRRWSGGETTVRWTVVTASRVTSVVIDPEVEWPVEVRRADNAWHAAGSWWRLWLRPPWLAPGLQLIGLLTWPWA